MTDNEKENNGNGWNSWKIYVIKTLEKIIERQDKIEEDHKKEKIEDTKDITELKTKQKVSSAIISLIVALIIGIAINVVSAWMMYNWVSEKYEHTPRSQQQVEDTINKKTE